MKGKEGDNSITRYIEKYPKFPSFFTESFAQVMAEVFRHLPEGTKIRESALSRLPDTLVAKYAGAPDLVIDMPGGPIVLLTDLASDDMLASLRDFPIDLTAKMFEEARQVVGKMYPPSSLEIGDLRDREHDKLQCQELLNAIEKIEEAITDR